MGPSRLQLGAMFVDDPQHFLVRDAEHERQGARTHVRLALDHAERFGFLVTRPLPQPRR
jgi:hypothetical protein